ncbi:MAG: [NiFe]-hydrogenase assembly chaperone HybE [Candidatus Thiodiazotropha sp.]
MPDLETLTQQIESAFKRIEREQMQGIPLLNPALQVQTVGFQSYEGRTLGVVITPWMMSLILLPAASDDWSGLKPGDKQHHRLPANEYRFMFNEIEGIGLCQTHSLYSPMHEFMNQDHAVAAAGSFMQTLMVPVENPDTDPYGEELLGRVLRGEETPEVELDGFARAESNCPPRPGCVNRQEDPSLTRREFLLGKEA